MIWFIVSQLPCIKLTSFSARGLLELGFGDVGRNIPQSGVTDCGLFDNRQCFHFVFQVEVVERPYLSIGDVALVIFPVDEDMFFVRQWRCSCERICRLFVVVLLTGLGVSSRDVLFYDGAGPVSCYPSME